jgi:L-fuculose-phosphate aldolase
LLDQKLVVGTAGNVSVRIGDHVVISPSGVDYRKMRAEHVVVVDIDGNVVEGSLKPSSELPLHLAVYTTSAHQAIVHTHAVASTALSVVVDEIPLSHYYSAMFGGPVRVAAYATYGSEQLALNVQAALVNRTAALMANHGAVSVAATLAKALDQLPYLEYICELQLTAMSTGRDIKLLGADEIERVANMLGSYGQKTD